MDNLPLLWINTEDTGTRLRYTMEVCFAFIVKIPYAMGRPEDRPSSAISLTLPSSSTHPAGILRASHWRSYAEIGDFFNESLTVETAFLKEGADWPGLAFLILTRYEEQVKDAPKDYFERFPALASHQLKLGLLSLPVIKIWILKELEKVGYPLHLIPKRSAQKVTVDIDRLVWAKNDFWSMFWPKLMADVLQGRWTKAQQRWAVNQGATDPFDATTAIHFLVQQGWEPLVFLLLNPKPDGRWDRNLKPNHPLMLEFIKAFPKERFGIHPSLASHKNLDQLKAELVAFEKLVGYRPKYSRQHYLKIHWLDTFRNLESLGIEEEHSLVFPEMAGFRCGTSSPYPWYDLANDRISKLMVHPPVWMDRSHISLEMKELNEGYSRIKEICAQYDEPFETIWHNDSLCAGLEWAHWKEFIYTQLGGKHDTHS
jgi:hypothetical protein